MNCFLCRHLGSVLGFANQNGENKEELLSHKLFILMTNKRKTLFSFNINVFFCYFSFFSFFKCSFHVLYVVVPKYNFLWSSVTGRCQSVLLVCDWTSVIRVHKPMHCNASINRRVVSWSVLVLFVCCVSFLSKSGLLSIDMIWRNKFLYDWKFKTLNGLTCLSFHECN